MPIPERVHGAALRSLIAQGCSGGLCRKSVETVVERTRQLVRNSGLVVSHYAIVTFGDKVIGEQVAIESQKAAI